MIPTSKNLKALKITKGRFELNPILALMVTERWAGKKTMLKRMYWR